MAADGKLTRAEEAQVFLEVNAVPLLAVLRNVSEMWRQAAAESPAETYYAADADWADSAFDALAAWKAS